MMYTYDNFYILKIIICIGLLVVYDSIINPYFLKILNKSFYLGLVQIICQIGICKILLAALKVICCLAGFFFQGFFPSFGSNKT